MSETETTVPMDDKALFESAIANEAPAAPAETVVTEEKPAEQTDGPARDEQGRFAAKEATQEQAPEPAKVEAKPAETVVPKPAEAKQEPPPGWIPAWRAREIADARAREVENRYRQAAPPTEPIDPYIDPEKFRDAGVRQAIEPVTQQMAEVREHYSRKDAIRTYGQETVNAAYDWLKAADQSGDPRAQAFIANVKQSIDPFEEIVSAYKRDKALSTVGDDPNAWFEKELARRMEADPAFKAKVSATPAQGSPTNIVKLPPSLNRQPGSAGNTDQGGMDDKSLYAFATS